LPPYPTLFRAPPTRPLRPRRTPPRTVTARRRHRRVTRVTRQQMLQPGQPARQLLVGPLQLRDPLGLDPNQRDQILAGHLLRLGHSKIKPHQTDSRRPTPPATQPAFAITLRATAECLQLRL